MELSDDLVAIQGILISVIKSTGEFTKIYYKGGNEEKILKIIEEIHKYISSKNYIKDGKINTIFDKQMEDIILFLAINTKYKKSLELEDYDHLIDIMPKLSKCVLANIVYGLDSCKYYCKVIEKLPLSFGIELLEEMIPCLKKSLPEIQLHYAIMFLRASATKLSSIEISEDEDDIYNISEVTGIILQFLTGIHPGHVKNLKAAQIYQHMGYILLGLFDLLLQCRQENDTMKKFIDNILKTCCIIIQNVTINVFCSWAEINEGDETLQSAVASKAYLVVEDYQKYEDAKDLISMLGTIAKKPSSLSERVQAADVETIIKKVYIKDEDQLTWFRALLGTNIFDNKDAMQCVSDWARLCDENDVTRLLNLNLQTDNAESNQLVLKCISTLTLKELLLVMTRYFYETKFKGLVSDTETVESQLKLIFKKMSGQTELDDDFIKDMCLLMVQDPSVVLKSVYGECLRNKCYTPCYEKFFATIKDIANVNDFGVETLFQVILWNQPNINNLDNYVDLLKMLLEMGYVSNSQVINDLLLPLLDKFQWEKGFGQLGCVLQIFLGCSLKVPATSEMTNARWTLLNATNDCRCTFLEMNLAKQQCVNYAVDVIVNLCEVNPDYNFEKEPHTAADTTKHYDGFTKYYKSYLSSKTDKTLLKVLYSDFNIEKYECVSRVLGFLPRAVTWEWTNIVKDMIASCGSGKAMELLTDVLILLSKVAQSQEESAGAASAPIITGLKYCVQQYGLSVQNIQSDSVLEMEVNITKNICRLLKHLPEPLIEEEGLSIINVLTERSLKHLNNDREFVCSLLTIKNNLICRTLAQRMMDTP